MNPVIMRNLVSLLILFFNLKVQEVLVQHIPHLKKSLFNK